jgi:hypothetical protein
VLCNKRKVIGQDAGQPEDGHEAKGGMRTLGAQVDTDNVSRKDSV